MYSMFGKSRLTELLIGALILLPSIAMAGDIIRVKSDYPVNVKLSDLYVYNNGERHTILKANDPSDDIELTPGEQRIFEAPWEIKRYFVSRTEYATPSEMEAVCINVTQQVPKEISFLTDPNGIVDLALAIDFSMAGFDTIPSGTILDFVNGTNPTVPGWFVGTTVNYETGDVTGPYTGSVEIHSNPFVVMLTESIPTLTEWGLIIFGVVLLGFITWVFLKRRKVVGVRV